MVSYYNIMDDGTIEEKEREHNSPEEKNKQWSTKH
jgi:hypothetical protein